jgi:hypothetical protein
MKKEKENKKKKEKLIGVKPYSTIIHALSRKKRDIGTQQVIW